MTEAAVPKYPRTPYWASSPSIALGDRTVGDPERFVGCEVVATEKLDGGCTLLHNGLVFARSTAAPSTQPWMAMVKKYHAWKLAGSDVFLYGEDLYGVHSITYQPLPMNRTFYAFALWHADGMFAGYDDLMSFAASFDMPTVPELHRGVFDASAELSEFLAQAHQQPSMLGGEREGIVVRRTEAFHADEFAGHVCKSVRPNHV